MSNTKEEILALLKKVIRDGMPELITWLTDETDFFTAPSSTKYHGNYAGGLADHSLNVYDSLVLLQSEYMEKHEWYHDNSIILVALLHDVCKTGYYYLDEDPASDAQLKFVNDLLDKADREPLPREQRTKGYVSKVIEYLKNGGDSFPEFSQTFKVKDELPMGHGEKSLYMIQKHIKLTDAEALAIRWHLGGYDPGFHFGFPSGFAAQQAIRENKLCSMLISADFLATWLVDETVK